MFFFIVGTMPLSFPQLKHHRLRIITDFLFLLWSRWLLKVICKSWAAYNTGAPVCLPNLGCAIVHSLAVYALCLKIDLVCSFSFWPLCCLFFLWFTVSDCSLCIPFLFWEHLVIFYTSLKCIGAIIWRLFFNSQINTDCICF